MIKNNIRSLLIHVMINILALITYIPFHISVVKWASEEAAKNHHIVMISVAITIIAVALFLYYYFSGVFLKEQGSNFKNIMSISLTGFIGIFIWFIAFNMNLAERTNALLNSEVWQLYSLYYSYSLFLVDEAAISIPNIMLVFCIMPTLAMWVGIKYPINSSNIKVN
ncbi:hypothetical protein J2Z44_004235 [Clostridium punense]|uniref:Uncharacterized protein n=1 Tax=Clostridium punense TaxID=1054297 RepID=A0ABS4K9B8_9CLOT|nr:MULTISPECIES: hypothetical protein [Clostridium]EQB85823.1 hypothetical protein M918_17460 [Clostridium sp. BL8]MBP2024367.1 hypothetical protein [Clostridium punense]